MIGGDNYFFGRVSNIGHVLNLGDGVDTASTLLRPEQKGHDRHVLGMLCCCLFLFWHFQTQKFGVAKYFQNQ